MNVSHFLQNAFSTLLTAHFPGVFVTSKSDTVQLRSLFPDSVPQLLIADATVAKVGPAYLCSSDCAQEFV